MKRLKGGEDGMVVFSVDGKQLVTVSLHGTVTFWDMVTGEEVKQLKVVTRTVLVATISFDGTWLALGGYGMVGLWDAATGEEVRQLEAHIGIPGVMAFSSDGERLICWSDRTVQVWNAVTGQEIRRLIVNSGVVGAVALSSDRKWLASGFHDGTVKLWNVEMGEEVQQLKGHSGEINAVAFSADNKRLALASHDRTLRIWDIEDKARKEVEQLQEHEMGINVVIFSPDGTQLASGSRDGTVRLWNMNGEDVKLLEGDSSVWALAFSSDGKWLASGSEDGVVSLCNMEREGINRLAIYMEDRSETIWVRAVAFSPDTKWLAIGLDGTIILWNVEKEEVKCLKELPGPGMEGSLVEGGWIIAVAVSPDGKWLASGSADRKVKLWNLEEKIKNETELLLEDSRRVPVVTSSSSSSSSSSASGTGGTSTSRLYNAIIGTGNIEQKVVKILNGDTDDSWTLTVAFSPDSNQLAAGLDNGKIKLWDVATGDVVGEFDQQCEVAALKFSTDVIQGKTIAIGHNSGMVSIFTLA
ncbi:hypothetical protein TWF173_010336 [Orbilia oligospora]|nr:hypothetical protein TWF173_010336 [Orbilia oligospora]